MTTMPPRGGPAGSARYAPSLKPSLAVRTICSPISDLQSRNFSSVAWRAQPKMTKGLPDRGTWPRCALGDRDPQEYQDKRDRVIGGERFAEQGDGEQGAEHRHEVDVNAGPPGPDQFDAAHEHDLCDQRGKQRRISQQREALQSRPNESAAGDLQPEQRDGGDESDRRHRSEKAEAGDLRARAQAD